MKSRIVAALTYKRSVAWHYKAYEREQPSIDRKVYADAKNEAKAARRWLMERS